MKGLKKGLVLLLSLAITFTFIPSIAFAADDLPEQTETPQVNENEDVTVETPALEAEEEQQEEDIAPAEQAGPEGQVTEPEPEKDSGDAGESSEKDAAPVQKEPAKGGTREVYTPPNCYIDENGMISILQEGSGVSFSLKVYDSENAYVEKGMQSLDTVDLKKLIDRSIRRGELINSASYEVTVAGWLLDNYNREVWTDPWTGTFEYSSGAVKIEPDFEIDQNGTLSWGNMPGAARIEVFIYPRNHSNGGHLCSVSLDGAGTKELKDYIDEKITNNYLEKSDTYDLSVFVYDSDSEELCEWNTTFNYVTTAAASYPGMNATLDEETGILTWEAVDDAYIYSISVNDYEIGSTDKPRSEYVKYALDNFVNAGTIVRADSYTVKLLAYNTDGQIIGLWSYDYVYDVPEVYLHAWIYDWGMNWENPGGADYYEITISDKQGGNKTITEYDDEIENLNGKIDGAVEEGTLAKVNEYKITIKAFEETGNTVIAEWSSNYSYTPDIDPPNVNHDLNATFDPDSSVLTWDTVDGAGYYSLMISDGYDPMYYNATNDPGTLNVNDLIDRAIMSGRLNKENTYDLCLAAYEDVWSYDALASWNYAYSYASSAEKVELNVQFDKNAGTITWNMHEDLWAYVDLTADGGLIGKYTSDPGAVDVNGGIDSLIENGVIDKADGGEYIICVTAFDEGGHNLQQWNDYHYYDSPAEPPELPEIEVTFDSETGILEWESQEGVYRYGLKVAGYESDGFYSGVNLKEVIDQYISNGNIEKNESYPITLYAYDDDLKRMGEWTTVFVYHSKVTGPFSFRVSGGGKLTWDEVEDADRYAISFVGSDEEETEIYDGIYTVKGVSLKESIENMIAQGTLEETDTYKFVIRVYDEDDFLMREDIIYYNYNPEGEDGFTFYVNKTTGEVVWDHSEELASIMVQINDFDYNLANFENDSFNIKEIIDGLIRDNYIVKTHDYEINVRAYDQSDNTMGSTWFDLEYDSSATPNELPAINVTFDEVTGLLEWMEYPEASRYELYINGTRYITFEGGRDTNVKDAIDDAIRNNVIVKADTYVLELYALAESNQKIAAWKYDYIYSSEAIPAEMINASIDENGVLTWNEVPRAYRYQVKIWDDRDDCYFAYDGGYYASDGINLRAAVDELIIYQGFVQGDEEYYINVEAFDINGNLAGYAYIDFEYQSDAVYQGTVLINASLNNDILSWESLAGVKQYIIEVDGERPMPPITDMQMDLREFINELMGEDDYYGREFDIRVLGLNEIGVAFAASEYFTYLYAHPVTELGPDDVWISDGYLFWNIVIGAYNYEIVLPNGENYFLNYYDEEDRFNVNERIDKLIINGEIAKAQDGKYELIFKAFDENDNLIAERIWNYNYNSGAEYVKPETFDITIENGILNAWYEGTDEYKIILSYSDGEYIGSRYCVGEVHYPIDRFIDYCLDDFDPDPNGKYNITVLAYNDEGIIIAKGEKQGYEYTSSEPPEITGITYNAETGMLTWDSVNDAKYYTLHLYNEDSEDREQVFSCFETSLNIQEKIDSLIRFEEITAPESGLYQFSIEAIDEYEFLVSKGTVSFTYNTDAHAPVFMEASINNGTLSWNLVEGAGSYRVAVNGISDTVGGSVTSYDIDYFIDILYTRGNIDGASSPYLISVTALNDKDQPIARTEEPIEYNYDPETVEEIEIQVVNITNINREVGAEQRFEFTAQVDPSYPNAEGVEIIKETWEGEQVIASTIGQHIPDGDIIDVLHHFVDIEAKFGYRFSEDVKVYYNGEDVDSYPGFYDEYTAFVSSLVEPVLFTQGNAKPTEISGLDIEVEDMMYTGDELAPYIEIYDEEADHDLWEGEDYTVTFANNVNAGTATATITGIYKYTGTVTVNFKIKPVPLSLCKVTLGTTNYTYDGKVKSPTVTVKDTYNDKTLKKNTNYKVTLATGRKNVGSYKVTVKGTGNYSGTVTRTFKINPKGTALKSVTAAKKALTVKWTAQKTKMSTSYITGYEIQIATDSKFTKNTKTITVAGYKKVSRKITGLKAKTNYYVRIRTYKTISGTKYYSAWSKAKTRKTK